MNAIGPRRRWSSLVLAAAGIGALWACGSASRPASDAGAPDGGPADSGVDDGGQSTECATGKLRFIRDPWSRPSEMGSYCDELAVCASSDALVADGWACAEPNAACSGWAWECTQPGSAGGREVSAAEFDTLCSLSERAEVGAIVCWVFL